MREREGALVKMERVHQAVTDGSLCNLCHLLGALGPEGLGAMEVAVESATRGCQLRLRTALAVAAAQVACPHEGPQRGVPGCLAIEKLLLLVAAGAPVTPEKLDDAGCAVVDVMGPLVAQHLGRCLDGDALERVVSSLLAAGWSADSRRTLTLQRGQRELCLQHGRLCQHVGRARRYLRSTSRHWPTGSDARLVLWDRGHLHDSQRKSWCLHTPLGRLVDCSSRSASLLGPTVRLLVAHGADPDWAEPVAAWPALLGDAGGGGTLVDAWDGLHWCVGHLVASQDEEVLVHFMDWSCMYDEWLPRDSWRLVPLGTHTLSCPGAPGNLFAAPDYTLSPRQAVAARLDAPLLRAAMNAGQADFADRTQLILAVLTSLGLVRPCALLVLGLLYENCAPASLARTTQHRPSI